MMNYLELNEMIKEDLYKHIDYIKQLQIEKFKNGFETLNWNYKDIIIPENLFFVNDVDLKKYVDENYVKNSILCLKLYNFPQYQNSCQTGQDIYDNIISLNYEINNDFYNNLINRVKEQKSLTKSCNNCKSIVKIEYISSHKCPICKDENFLFTDTDKQSLESKLSRLQKHEENYKEKSKKYYDKCINKVDKFINTQQNIESDELISYKWILVYDSNNIIVDENDIRLLNLRLNAYKEVYDIER